ncbi:glycosyltransferase family 2 protein [Pseudoduganella sp. LjRoot289]|uniref:glycosyltransferase family 2 protein n=1 Tax=Pseudoduganella sp. LjRoot289 TaxID=3342314 RepID=UPI003ECF82A3
MTKSTKENVRVLISVLNWNTAAATLRCVEGLLKLQTPADTTVECLVIDNGSADADFSLLQGGLPDGCTLLRHPRNLGFAGGHNVALRKAMAAGVEFVWLFNSDATAVQTHTLSLMLAEMTAHPRCGAVSPTMLNQDGELYFSGGYHDWSSRRSVWPALAENVVQQDTMPLNRWVPGTALLLRTAALRDVGLLNEKLFAYFEDDDIGARLAVAGWSSRVAFGAAVQHAMPRSDTERGSYYFYLMQRNYLMFWWEHTPPAHRRLLWLRLLDQGFYEANKLYLAGHHAHGDASLLGLYDFLRRSHGAPALARPVPGWVWVWRKLMVILQRRALKPLAST